MPKPQEWRSRLQEFGNNKPAAVRKSSSELPISAKSEEYRKQIAKGRKTQNRNYVNFQAEARNFSGSTETVETQCTGGTVQGTTWWNGGDHTQKLGSIELQSQSQWWLNYLYLVIYYCLQYLYS